MLYNLRKIHEKLYKFIYINLYDITLYIDKKEVNNTGQSLYFYIALNTNYLITKFKKFLFQNIYINLDA